MIRKASLRRIIVSSWRSVVGSQRENTADRNKGERSFVRVLSSSRAALFSLVFPVPCFALPPPPSLPPHQKKTNLNAWKRQTRQLSKNVGTVATSVVLFAFVKAL